MKTEEIQNNVLRIAGEVLKSIPKNVNEGTEFSSIPHWSSLNHALIINRIEKHYNIEFDLDEMIEVRTVGDICRLVGKKLS